MGIREEVDFLEVLIAELLERFFAGPGPGGGRAKQPDDRSALSPAVTGIASGDRIGRYAALPVRRPSQRHKAPLAGHKVLDLDSVADGEDIRIARAHLVVNADASAFADVEPRRLRQRSIRPHAQSEDHDVGQIRPAGLGLHLQRAALQLLECGDAVAKRQLYAMASQMTLDEAGDLAVERSQHLVEHFDERQVKPEMNQVLRHLEANESAADHHRAPGGFHELNPRIIIHPRQEGRAPFDPFADGPRVWNGPHLENSWQIDTRQRWTNRCRAGRQNQLVV